MQLVFNELSVSNLEANRYEAEDIFSRFLHVYSKAVGTGYGISRSLLTTVDINCIELTKGYYIAQWRNSSTIDKDEKRRFLGMCDKQRILSPDSEDCQYIQCGDAVGKGFQIAYEIGGLLISLATSDGWKKNELQCTLYDVEIDAYEELVLNNLYNEDGLRVHAAWIKEENIKRRVDIKTSNEFLTNLSTMFPSLDFHTHAISQITDYVQPICFPMLIDKLLMLEAYFAVWDGGDFDRSKFPPRTIAPESNETLSAFKKAHTFDWEGEQLLVSYHMRYTGGDVPGRIYFYPLYSQKRCLICSLYTKLPTVSDPKFKG